MKKKNQIIHLIYITVFITVYITVFILAATPLWGSTGEAGKDDLLMTLPVRTAMDQLGLAKEDLVLRVNGNLRPIRAMTPRQRSLNRPSDLSRYFVLSFHMESYKPDVMEAVEYFIQHVVRRNDVLTILSPLRAYRLKMEDGNHRVLDFIEETLKKDCSQYKLVRGGLIQKLDKDTAHVNRLRGPDGWMLNHYNTMFNFYNQSKLALVRFKDHFLAPHLKQDKVIRDLPPRGEGEIWWIHFQQRAFEPVPVKFRKVFSRIILFQKTGQVRWPVAGAGKSWDFDSVIKQMKLTNEFSVSGLPRAVLLENVCYNIINWGVLGDTFSNRTDASRPETERFLERIARISGGKSVTNINPLDGLQELLQHRDQYYEVAFAFDGLIEDKRFGLSMPGVNSGGRLFYSPGYTGESIRSRIDEIQRGKVRITDLSMQGNRVAFGVAAYHRPTTGGKEPVGLIKVRAQLYDDSGNPSPVFNSFKVLRAVGNDVRISLPLPKKYRGGYTFQLSVCDLMANQLASVKQKIRL